MIGFGLLFLIFGIALIMEGIANINGHKPYILKAKYAYDHITKQELQYMGKQIIAIGVGFTIGSIPSFVFEDDSLIPILIVFICAIISSLLYNIIKKPK